MQVRFEDDFARAVSFLDQKPDGPPCGQQLSRWLPGGWYSIQGIGELRVSDRGTLGVGTFVRLVNAKNPHFVYYVHTSFCLWVRDLFLHG